MHGRMPRINPKSLRAKFAGFRKHSTSARYCEVVSAQSIITKMPLKARYNPVYGNEYYLADTRSIPDYRIHRSYNFYDFWPYLVRLTLRNRPFRRWLTTPTYYRQSLYSNESSLVKSSSSVSRYTRY
ncbi:hypothetical protein HUJ04_004314 [Dendroctonus ponderosae]|uniref:Uncharacterized protein n=2 Tax=Dendroctonus ponderosae TaxID=77166 RepID=A0AAR5Q1E0_DENPD|nr:hypothetical protein HUJ04_004314 [Dendroctonus ponderosae]